MGRLTGAQKERLIRQAMDRGTTVIMAAMKYGLYGFAAYMAWKCIDSLAGKETSAEIQVLIDALIDIGKANMLPWAVAIVAVLFALRERRERQKKTEYLSARIQKLELMIDPNRTSSGIASTGETHDDDRYDH